MAGNQQRSSGSRSSAGGSSKKYRLNGAAMIFCVLPPFLQAQDRTRWTKMRVNKHRVTSEDAASGADVKAMLAYAKEISPQLWRRAIDGYGRYHKTLDVYNAAMAELGVDHRARDQSGAILAGRDLFFRDDAPSIDEARADVERFMEYLIRQHWPEDNDNPGMDCLNKLLSSRAHTLQRDVARTVGQLLAMVADGDASGSEAAALEALGIKFQKVCTCKPEDTLHSGHPVFYISNTHDGTRQIFRGSRWENGGWSDTLKSVPGAYSPKRPFRFAGSPTQKAIGIPYNILQDAAEMAAMPPAQEGGADDIPL